MNYVLDQRIEHIRSLRNELRFLKSNYQIDIETFNTLHKDEIDKIENIKAELELNEKTLKALALKIYQEGDKTSKNIYNFLKERDVTILHYKEEDALEWSKTHNLFLSLDKKSFENYIRSLKSKGVPSFVRVETKETVTISSEL